MELTEKVDSRISKDDRAWLEEQAEKDHRSVGAIIRRCIREAREAQEATK